MIVQNHYIFGKKLDSLIGTKLLNIFPNTTGGAWSVYRQLREEYSGSLIRVRRASDNAEIDVDAVSGFLDTSTLLSFCSGTSGYVTKIYDQTGNAYDFVMATTANQGRIVNAGSLEVQNGTPAIFMDGTNDRYSAGNILSAPTKFTISLVANVDAGEGIVQLLNKGIGAAGNREYAFSHQGLTIFNETTDENISVTGSLTKGSQHLFLARYNNDTDEVGYGENGNLFSYSTTVSIQSYSADLVLFSNPSGGNTYQGYFQEAVIWTDDLVADYTDITDNINNDFSIY